MTMSDEASRTQASPRAQALACRVLGGAGSASLLAYRLAETLPFVAHGMAADGSVVIAARPEGMVAAVAPGFAVDVRMDIVLNSPDPTVTIVAASVHLLGALTWAGDAETERLRHTGLPSLVADLLELPGMRLGVVDVQHAVLHDLDGATVVDLDELAPQPAADQLTAFEAVARHATSELNDLCWAVEVGRLPGQVSVSSGPISTCSHTLGKVFCVDVDRAGLTMMAVAPGEARVVYAPFPQVAQTAEAIPAAVDSLVASALAQVAA